MVGRLSPRVDLDALDAVAATGRSLLLVGPRDPGLPLSRFSRLLLRPNVHWTGPVPAEHVLAYLAASRVGLTPYVTTPFNVASFPLKTLEYLGAGLSAVVSDLPAHRWLDTPMVRVAGTPDRFAREVVGALDEADDGDRRQERRDFARQHTWDVRARAVLDVIDGGLNTARRAG
jgi:teichuronic acid biosynthesis glycosyltransferase TuaH